MFVLRSVTAKLDWLLLNGFLSVDIPRSVALVLVLALALA